MVHSHQILTVQVWNSHRKKHLLGCLNSRQKKISRHLNISCRLDIWLFKSREYPADQVVCPISCFAEGLIAHLSVVFFSTAPCIFNIGKSGAASRKECLLTGNLILLLKLLCLPQYSQISPAQTVICSFTTLALWQMHKLKSFPWETETTSPKCQILYQKYSQCNFLYPS